MAQNVPLNKGDVAIEPFFDATQEMLSGSAPSLWLSVLNSTTIQCVAGVGDAEQTASIMGRYRYVTANVSRAHPGGAAGTYDVFITGSDNDFTGVDPNIDVTNYAFGLEIRSGSTPATAIYRKVGEVDWDGTKLTALRQLAGARRDNAPLMPTAPIAGFTPLRVRGAAAQTADLATFEKSDGTALARVTSSGQLVAAAGLSAAAVAGGTALGTVQAAADVVLGNYLAGADAQPSFVIRGNGTLAWGPGGAGVLDTALGRTGEGLLGLTNSLHVGGYFSATQGIGLFGVTPPAQSAGWGTTGAPGTSTKSLSSASTLNNVIDFCMTLKEALRSYGLLGP